MLPTNGFSSFHVDKFDELLLSVVNTLFLRVESLFLLFRVRTTRFCTRTLYNHVWWTRSKIDSISTVRYFLQPSVLLFAIVPPNRVSLTRFYASISLCLHPFQVFCGLLLQYLLALLFVAKLQYDSFLLFFSSSFVTGVSPRHATFGGADHFFCTEIPIHYCIKIHGVMFNLPLLH